MPMINLTDTQLAKFFKNYSKGSTDYSLLYNKYANIRPGEDTLKAPGITIKCTITSVLLTLDESLTNINTNVAFTV